MLLAVEFDDRLVEAAEARIGVEQRIERAAAYARLGRAAESRADLERLTGPEVRPDIRRTAQRELARLARGPRTRVP